MTVRVGAEDRSRSSAAVCAIALGELILGLHLQPVDSFAAPAAPAVKLSRTGICHDGSSQHYAKLQEYQTFDSMQECVAAGGRPTRAAVKKSDGPPDEASRKPPRNVPWIDRTRSALEDVGIGWLLVAGIVIFALLVPPARGWYRRWQNRRTQAAFEEAELRRWRGHKLDPGANPSDGSPEPGTKK